MVACSKDNTQKNGMKRTDLGLSPLFPIIPNVFLCPLKDQGYFYSGLCGVVLVFLNAEHEGALDLSDPFNNTIQMK